MNIIEWLRVIFLGIVEGITEWLPVSSTGHLILVDAFWKTSAPEVFTAEFTEMFDVVIQLGAILAVVTVFFYKLNPFSARKTKEQKHNTIELWKKVIIGCIPAGVIGILFNDLIDNPASRCCGWAWILRSAAPAADARSCCPAPKLKRTSKRW